MLKDELAMLPAGSKISLTAELQAPRQTEIVTLADNGPGLPPAALQVVLDPFTVTGGGPSEYGINLMACFFIAHHHGGKIEANSQPGAATPSPSACPSNPNATPSRRPPKRGLS